jgi:hypothetical protein
MDRSRRSSTILLLAALLACAATTEAQQAAGKKDRSHRWPGSESAGRVGQRPSPAGAGTLTSVGESEPNDTPATANPVTLGTVATGRIDPPGDVDFFSFHVPAGTALDLEVTASRTGSALDSELFLVAPDGNTVLAYSDDAGSLDSRIRYSVERAGTYYAAITGFARSGGPDHGYSLRFGTVAPGPGDPTRVHASGLSSPWRVAAGPGGELYAIGGDGLVRIDASGVVTPLLRDVWGSDLVVDGYGDILLAVPESGVQRVTPQGAISAFTQTQTNPRLITLDPQGDVWVHSADGRLLRFDSNGALLSQLSLQVWLFSMAFSPAGELHFSTGESEIYKLVGSQPQRVLSHASSMGGVAFDRDGYLYVGTLADGILLFDPTHHPVGESFAIGRLSAVSGLAFGRGADGAMTRRLFGVSQEGIIVEVNTEGVRAPGQRLGVDLLRIVRSSLRDAVVGASFADTLAIVGGAAARWSVTSGALPPGLSLDAASGVVSGTPEQNGSFAVHVRAESGSQFGAARVTITVNRPQVDVAALASHLLGAPGGLTPEIETFLDLQGNRNGRFDIGDLRAYLRGEGILPSQLPASIQFLLQEND